MGSNMGSVAFQLGEAQASVFPPVGNGNAAIPPAAPSIFSQNQGTQAPQDTVTLSSQATQVQPANAANAAAKPVNQPAVPTLPVALKTSPPQQTAAQPAVPQQPPQVAVQQQHTPQQAAAQQAVVPADDGIEATANQNSATDAQNAAPAASAAAGPQTPQQQLTQLDQSLQGLGISPQSIPLPTRMAMLIYSNDPAALRLLVSQLQPSDQTSTSGVSVATGNPTQAQGSTQALLPAQSQGAPQPQTQSQSQAATFAPAPAAAQASVAQENLGNDAADLTQPSQTAAAANTQPANLQQPAQQTDAFALQLSEVQSSFTALEQQGAPPGSSALNQPSPGLNVTA